MAAAPVDLLAAQLAAAHEAVLPQRLGALLVGPHGVCVGEGHLRVGGQVERGAHKHEVSQEVPAALLVCACVCMCLAGSRFSGFSCASAKQLAKRHDDITLQGVLPAQMGATTTEAQHA